MARSIRVGWLRERKRRLSARPSAMPPLTGRSWNLRLGAWNGAANWFPALAPVRLQRRIRGAGAASRQSRADGFRGCGFILAFRWTRFYADFPAGKTDM